MLDGPECISGHYLQAFPRQLVEISLRDMDRLKRHQYIIVNLMLQHADGYDKLKPYGFPVHGCIDDWSIRLL
ncbi:unnamed protein product [Porites evermanni]|uniref:Uncharacterized protein n=1 Tax=Porites evermanni TaxID=104178 RepID=A0ABN8M584_9CNID|nr:unnamed protein product [Porites evermanni]